MLSFFFEKGVALDMYQLAKEMLPVINALFLQNLNTKKKLFT